MARTRSELARWARGGVGEGLALVPTMGFLHEGHLSLVDLARERSARVAVSIFVNPLQFGPAEDYARYPRSEETDLAMLEARGVWLVFVPDVEEMYPGGPPSVTVRPGPMGDRLCGAFRPGHFEGVLTVVAKLFGLFHPEVAVFGRKDFQQSVLIRRMAHDLELGVEVLGAPTVREPDGLALSSRNAYLSREEREQAVGLFQALEAGLQRALEEERSAAAIRDAVTRRLGDFPLLEPQYVDVVDPKTLEPAETLRPGTVAAVAAFCGHTRLIDNVELP